MNEMRYRILRCAKELAKVPIEEVAKIAAMLVHNGAAANDGLPRKDVGDEKIALSKATTQKRVDQENPLVVATAKAFELLEIAYYGNFGLNGKGSYEAGLAKFVEGKKIDEEGLEAEAKIPEWDWKYDEHGKKQPVPFDQGLKELMPLPGYSKAKANDERIARFKPFFVCWLRSDPNEDERELAKKADDAIGEMKRSGIPPREFGKWRVMFPEWWKRKVSHSCSTAGQQGQQAKGKRKERQGRVISKKDRRLGARGPLLASALSS